MGGFPNVFLKLPVLPPREAPAACHGEARQPPVIPRRQPPVIPRSARPLLFRGSSPPVIPRSETTRNLLEFATPSRLIPDCGFLTPPWARFGMTREKMSWRGAPAPPVIPRHASPPVIPRRARPLLFRGSSPPVIPRSETTRNLLESATPFSPYSRLQIPHPAMGAVRNDKRKDVIPD
jgi:hypothetical protein